MTFTPEWRCCSMHDPSGRRGVWHRLLPDGRLEIRAGREGDDAAAFVPAECAAAVKTCLDYGAWMREDYGPEMDVDGPLEEAKDATL